MTSTPDFSTAVLALDAGTTGVTALLVDHSARVVARGYSEFAQHFPGDGWVEHEPRAAIVVGL